MHTRRTPQAALAALLSVVLSAVLALIAFGAAPSPLDSLAKTERDFARLSVERGIDVAFDANFADDGISFSPHPVKRRDEIAKRPATKPKQDFILDWYPTLSDVSAAGDLGYNTGPWIVSDPSPERRPLQHGYFCSVWKRQADGLWKVVVDLGSRGVKLPATEVAASWRGARHDTFTAKGEVRLDAEREAVRRREKELTQAVAAKGFLAAYTESLTGDFRVYRSGQPPFADMASLTPRLQAEQARGQVAWEPTAVDVARSADLAYTWGSYSLTAKAVTEPVEKGYYLHVWRRNAQGEWRLAIEVSRELPAERKVVTVDSAIYEAYVGEFELAPGFILTVTREGNKLITQATGQQKVEIFPSSETEFFFKAVDVQLRFVRGPGGTVDQIVLHQDGRDLPAKRRR